MPEKISQKLFFLPHIKLLLSHQAKENIDIYKYFCSAHELRIGLYITILTGLHDN